MTEAPYFEAVHRGSWWRKRGDQPLLYRTRIRSLRRLAPDGVLVDVGAGEGYFAGRASKHWTVIAVEQRLDGALRTRQIVPDVVRGDGLHLAIRPHRVQIVTLWDVAEHVADPSRLFDEVAASLARGGVLAMSTPNPDAWSVRCRGSGSVQHTDPTHLSILELDRWITLLERAGFEVVRHGTDGWWDPPYVRAVPRFVWTALSQAMFATRISWPFRSGENLIIVATKR